MPTQLAQTAKATRIFFFGSIILVVLYLILTQTLGLVFGYLRSLKPPPEIPATVGFGKLPPLNFRSFKLAPPRPDFELETTTGELPLLPNKVPVYEVVEPKASYLSLDKAKDVAKRLGFLSAAKSISSSLYLWEEEDRTLKMNIFTENFILEANLSRFVIPIGELPTVAEMRQQAGEYLKAKGLLKYGYGGGESRVALAKIEQGQISKTEIAADASLAQINFYRSLDDPENKVGENKPPLLPPNPAEGLVQLLAYAPKRAVGVLRFKYYNWEINREKSETYPLRPIALAWQELIDGRAVISLLKDRNDKSFDYTLETSLKTVIIRQIYLAYFDDESLQKFLQPIYVFEGDGRGLEGNIYDFTAYVPATDPAWVE